MTTKRWNAGTVVALTILLIMTPMLRFGTASAAGNSETAKTSYTPEAARCVTLHRVTAPKPGENHLDLHLEDLRGVLISNNENSEIARILLLNSRIPADLAGTIDIGHPLVESIRLIESTWGHESEARIDITAKPGARIETREGVDTTEVKLSAGSESFTLNFKATPYPVAGKKTGSLKNQLMALAEAPKEDNGALWWAESKPQDDMKAMLRAVRDADIKLAKLDAAVMAAQDDESGEGSSSEEAPVVEEAESASDSVEAPVPPAKREPVVTKSVESNKELTKQLIAASAPPLEGSSEPVVRKAWTGNPLHQPITMEFRDERLLNVVPILANMAGINVVTGAALGENDRVTLNLKNVPLLQAMETALRLNGLGIVEEQGIYIIKPYLEAIADDRMTEVVDIQNADAEEIGTTLSDVIAGSEFETLISISSNKTANTVIISGPVDHISPLIRMASRLDVEQAVLPTVTMPIKLNYAEPADMLAVIEGILTKDVGRVTVDERARILVVTDIPIIVEQITSLVDQLDVPVKSVAIDAMIVDVTLTDAADTGVDWLISAVQSQSRRDAAGNTGIFTGNLQDLSLDTGLSIGDAAGLLNFGILSGDIDWRGVIQAEVRNNNSTLLSNPRLITVENQAATITIASEIPYVELTSTEQGGQQTSTEFKPIGTELSVTPQVTHDDHIIAKINAKESTSSQQVNGVPVEDLRQIDTTPHLASGQTIYVGGLRKNNDTVSVRKVPILGDVPVMNFLFRSNQRSETVNELLIFLTCTVLDEEMALTEYQSERADQVRNARIDVSAETALIYDAVNPEEMRDPAWKWRKHRSE
jgi:type IV pilus secretin PilQ/predicted competence protein